MPRPEQKIHIGVAGWSYPDWKGIFYPHPRPPGFDPLRFLASYVDVIEINSTFYRPPEASYTTGWAERVEGLDRFHYTAKLHRRFTHERNSAWSAAEVKEMKQGLVPLVEADLLGALLMQFPWSFRNDEAGREWLDDLRQAFEELPLVVEVRHESWNNREFFDWLAETGVGFVNIDQPQFSKSIKPSARATSRIGYVRVHGRNYQDWFRKDAGRDARYDYLYTTDELRPWLKRTREVARDDAVESVDVVFNNHYKAKAVVNALEFRTMASRRVVRAPDTLAETYGKDLRTAGVKVEDIETAMKKIG